MHKSTFLLSILLILTLQPKNYAQVEKELEATRTTFKAQMEWTQNQKGYKALGLAAKAHKLHPTPETELSLVTLSQQIPNYPQLYLRHDQPLAHSCFIDSGKTIVSVTQKTEQKPAFMRFWSLEGKEKKQLKLGHVSTLIPLKKTNRLFVLEGTYHDPKTLKIINHKGEIEIEKNLDEKYAYFKVELDKTEKVALLTDRAKTLLISIEGNLIKEWEGREKIIDFLSDGERLFMIDKESPNQAQFLDLQAKPTSKIEMDKPLQYIDIGADSSLFIVSGGWGHQYDPEQKLIQTFKSSDYGDNSHFEKIDWINKNLILWSTSYSLWQTRSAEDPSEDTIVPGRGAYTSSYQKIVLSPDSKRIAVLADHRYLSVDFAAAADQYTREFEKPLLLFHEKKIVAADFSGSNKIITAGEDGLIKLWDLADLNSSKSLSGSGYFNKIFHPKNRYILASSSDWQTESGSVDLWTINGDFVKNILRGLTPFSLDYSDKAEQFLTYASEKRSSIRLWNLEGEQVTQLKHDAAITDASFLEASDGETYILSASLDSTARLWTLEGKEKIRLRHDQAVKRVQISKNRQAIVVTVGDELFGGGPMLLWTKARKEPIELMKTAYTSQDFAWFTEDSKFLVLEDREYVPEYESSVQKITVWEIEKGIKAKEWDSNITDSWSSTKDSLWLVDFKKPETVQLWSIEGKQLSEFKHNTKIEAVEYLAERNQLIVHSGRGDRYFYDLDGNLKSKIEKATGDYLSTFSKDYSLLATANHDSTVTIWDLTTGKLKQKLTFRDATCEVVFSDDGKWLLIETGDRPGSKGFSSSGTVELWSVDGYLVKRLGEGYEHYRGASFLKNGQLIQMRSSRGTEINIFSSPIYEKRRESLLRVAEDLSRDESWLQKDRR